MASRSDDLAVWNAELFADPEVTRYLPMDGALSDAALAGAFERGLGHWEAHRYGLWAVCDGTTGVFMGHCGLRFLDDVGETELYYALAQPYWGSGTPPKPPGAPGLRLRRRRTHRIAAFAVPENRASANVMVKLGMVFEAEVDIFGLHCSRYAIDRATWRPPSA